MLFTAEIKAFEMELRSLVELDGGHARVELAGDTLRVHLWGACAGCPALGWTQRMAIAPLVRQFGLTSLCLEVVNTSPPLSTASTV